METKATSRLTYDEAKAEALRALTLVNRMVNGEWVPYYVRRSDAVGLVDVTLYSSASASETTYRFWAAGSNSCT